MRSYPFHAAPIRRPTPSGVTEVGARAATLRIDPGTNEATTARSVAALVPYFAGTGRERIE